MRGMDTAALRKAYEELLAEIALGGFGPPQDGEWSAAQVVAHVVTNDDLLVDTTRARAHLPNHTEQLRALRAG
jgi:hypothetical protein